MAVPKFFEFFEVFLRVVEDGELHTAKEVRESIARHMNLSEEDRMTMLPSGKQSTFDNRVAWAKTYLNKAGLVETPVRGSYRITEEGRKALESGKPIDLDYLAQFKSFKDFHDATEPGAEANSREEKNESPMELLDSAFQQVNSALASQLMDEVMKLSPGDFEKLVVNLLLQMGYGSGIEEAGTVTPLSHDGGIDGIIKEDQLGFSNIYIQAKQWALDTTISKPEIQKFVGALQEQQAQKGLFITTAKFTAGAEGYVKKLSGTKVVLVDGDKLAKLMIKHNVGVSAEHVYEIKKVDADFFLDSF